MRGDQLARQWQLIQHLARSRAGVGLDTLVEELGCVRRTVYRDLDALMFAGFPVLSEKRDGKVYYRFLDSFQIGDVPFTTDEILALAFGEDLLRSLEGTVFHDSIRSALAKIRAGLGEDLVRYLDQLGERFRVMPGPHKQYAESKESIQILNDAVLESRSVDVLYHTGSTGKQARRRLDPYRVWYRSGGLYVIGHDHRSGEVRTFAVDRIRAIDITETRFKIPEDFDFDAYTASSFGVVAEEPSDVEIHFSKSWSPYVSERSWHPSQVLRPLAQGRVALALQVGETPELVSWILSFGAGAEVVAPASLRAVVRESLAEAVTNYAE
jgi:predicted DNA-binding transcriptional regulator YafY